MDYANEAKLYKGDGGNALVTRKDGTTFRTKENPNKFESMKDFINDDKPGQSAIVKYNEIEC